MIHMTEHYESNEGRQLFDTKRSFIHEAVHALTPSSG